MTIKERIENNLAIWMLGTLLTGFLSGLGAYEGILRIAHLRVVSGDDKGGQLDTTGADTSQIYWLKITDISLDKGGDNVQGLRIHVRVDDNPIAYPIKSVWAQPNIDRVSSLYPLYLPTGKGRLDVVAIARTNDGSIIHLRHDANDIMRVDVTRTSYSEEFHAARADNSLPSPIGVRFRIDIRKDAF